LTTGTRVSFIEGAECPQYDAFLLRAFADDQDLVDYYWRAVGYSLSGYVDQDALFFCYGEGANGKSTMFGALDMLFGDLGTTLSIETLLASGSDATVAYAKASLEGKRMVVTDELSGGSTLKANVVKALIGGDDIVARRPYQMPYTFKPTHKIWMVGNHKPKIAEQDHGIWRRIHLIPWTITIPKGEQVPRSQMLAVFRTELPGILWRALCGYMDYRSGGCALRPPESVLRATSEYREEENVLGRWVASALMPCTDARVATSEAYEAFKSWCTREGEEVPKDCASQAKFTARLKQPDISLDVKEGKARKTFIEGRVWAE
jgi:P4 family phage/plasmid primase-like protien